MSWKSVRCITVVSVIGLTSLGLPAVEGQGVGLFSAVNRAEQLDSPTPASLDAITLRSRVVMMDLDRLQRARATAAALLRSPVQSKAVSPPSGGRDAVPAADEILTLNLFEDAVFTGIVKRTAPTFSGGYSISGRLVDDPLGTLTLVVNGETVAGSVRTLGGTYQIRSVGGGPTSGLRGAGAGSRVGQSEAPLPMTPRRAHPVIILLVRVSGRLVRFCTLRP